MPNLSLEQLKELWYSNICHGDIAAKALLHTMVGSSCTEEEYELVIDEAANNSDVVKDLAFRALAKWPRTDLAGVDTHTPSHFFVETFPRVEPGAEEQMEEAFYGYLIRVKAPAFIASVWWRVCAPKGSTDCDPSHERRGSDAYLTSIAPPHWFGPTPPAPEQTAAIQESSAWLIAHYKSLENPDEEQVAVAERAALRAEIDDARVALQKRDNRVTRARFDDLQAKHFESCARSAAKMRKKHKPPEQGPGRD